MRINHSIANRYFNLFKFNLKFKDYFIFKAVET